MKGTKKKKNAYDIISRCQVSDSVSIFFLYSAFHPFFSFLYTPQPNKQGWGQIPTMLEGLKACTALDIRSGETSKLAYTTRTRETSTV